MTIQITGKNLDIGDALREYAEDRITDMLEKYVGRTFPGHIRIEKNKKQFSTNCSVDLWSGLSLHSHGESESAHNSVDIALERLDKRLRRYKSRLRNHHGNQNKAIPQHSVADYTVEHDDNDTTPPEELSPVIIAETQSIIRELPVSDAVMELDLANRPFLLFKNAGHGRINVVYRREDDNIGWIDLGSLSQ